MARLLTWTYLLGVLRMEGTSTFNWRLIDRVRRGCRVGARPAMPWLPRLLGRPRSQPCPSSSRTTPLVPGIFCAWLLPFLNQANSQFSLAPLARRLTLRMS